MQIALLVTDQDQSALIAQVLQAAGYACHPCKDDGRLPEHLQEHACDLLIADWPAATSRLRLLRAVRGHMAEPFPILLLAERGSEETLVAALEAGACDYLVQPLRRGELAMRVKVLLARAYPEAMTEAPQRFGAYAFETGAARLTRNGVAIQLTRKEFDLALLFFRNLGRPLSRAYLQEAIWAHDTDLPSRTIDTHVSRVRSKLGLHPENGFRLVPVYSFGYRLEQVPE